MLHYKTYQLDAPAEWVVFVHGAGGSSNIWYKQIRPFRNHFNLLFIDLRGHGNSPVIEAKSKNYTFDEVSLDILEVMDHLQIKEAHFVGVSLGTILIRKIVELAPERVTSMVLGGAVTRLTIRSRTLAATGNILKDVVPYMWLYNIAAWVIMPNRKHKKSRLLFVREAKKLYQQEFIRWFRLTAAINPLLRLFEEKEPPVPTLYLMGENDYLFLPPVEHLVKKHTTSKLLVIKNSGHVCNVDNAEEFNRQAVEFIKQSKKHQGGEVGPQLGLFRNT